MVSSLLDLIGRVVDLIGTDNGQSLQLRADMLSSRGKLKKALADLAWERGANRMRRGHIHLGRAAERRAKRLLARSEYFYDKSMAIRKELDRLRKKG